MPLRGIEAGDLGSKLGYNSENNGWMSFDQVRIPRTNLLSRYGEVSKLGKFEMKGDPRILYNIMVQTRMEILEGCRVFLHKGLLIAGRYAVCRRQFHS